MKLLAFTHSRANPIPACLWRLWGLGAHKRQGNLAVGSWRGFKESGPWASAACMLSQLVGGTEMALFLIACVKTPPYLGQRYHTQSMCRQAWDTTDSSPCLHPMSTSHQCTHFTLLALAQRGLAAQDVPGVMFIMLWGWKLLWVLHAVTVRQCHQCVADYNSYPCDNSLG